MTLLRGNLVFLFLFSVFFPTVAFSQEEGSSWEKIRKKYALVNSVQTGFEFDSNVFKTFGVSRSDAVARLRLNSRGRIPLARLLQLGWNYQGGGKKYFQHDEQDTMIHHLGLPLRWQPHPRVLVKFSTEIKLQDERDKLDADPAVAEDINEDFWSTLSSLGATVSIPWNLTLDTRGSYTYFHFDPQENFSFHREQANISLSRKFGFPFSMGVAYSHGRQQFSQSPREDISHEGSVFLQFTRIPFASLRYTYQDTNSNDARFSYINHRITLLLSVPLGHRDSAPGETQEAAPLFALHLLGVLQFKKFPSVFDFTEEGQRFLLTGSEDDVFNVGLIKLSYHPMDQVALEAKYTRYSNELSDQEEKFSRAIVYSGIRISF